MQGKRDRQKRENLAKPTEWNSIWIDKLDQISVLGDLAKPTDCQKLPLTQIEGIVRFLKAQLNLAKLTGIDKA